MDVWLFILKGKLAMRIKKEYKSIFFKSEKMPYLEARFVKNSSNHYHKHFHNTFSIGAIEEGKVSFAYLQESTILYPNELVVINPNIVHSCNPIKNESRTYHMIYLDTLWCQKLQESLFGEVNSYIPVSEFIIKDKNLYNKFIQLNYTLLNRDIFYLEKEEALQNFLTKLFGQYCNKNLQNYTIKENKNIQLAKEYIDKNINSNPTVKEISEIINISEFHFFKLFKQTFHISPHAYLLNQKICRAKELLANQEEIAQVAYELGFADQSHFSRVFKSYVAVTPNEYKKSFSK